MVGLAVDDDAKAHAGAHGDIDAVGHRAGAAPHGLPQGGGVDVGVNAHRDAQSLLVRKEVRRQLRGYVQGKGLDNLDEYIVPVSLGDNQGVMGFSWTRAYSSSGWT